MNLRTALGTCVDMTLNKIFIERPDEVQSVMQEHNMNVIDAILHLLDEYLMVYEKNNSYREMTVLIRLIEDLKKSIL